MVTLSLTQDDIRALEALIDGGVRYHGSAAVDAAYAVRAKLQYAVEQANRRMAEDGGHHHKTI